MLSLLLKFNREYNTFLLKHRPKSRKAYATMWHSAIRETDAINRPDVLN